jgi:hypothetical protein
MDWQSKTTIQDREEKREEKSVDSNSMKDW